MTARQKAQLQIHLCVLLWGFTAILGRAISLGALPLVWWRMLVVTATLLLVGRVRRGLRGMGWRLRGAYAGVGMVLALHWVTFYGAIKLANASVASSCIALAPVFVALVEPFIARKRFAPRELVFGVAAVPGVVLVAGGVPSRMHVGLVIGILSAFFVAIFGVLNKRLVHYADALTVTCLEIGAGAVLLTVIGLSTAGGGPAFPVPGARDALLLLVLAFACTVVPFALSLVALRELSAFTTALAVNLEPVYAVVLALLVFHEQRELELRFYAGVAILVATVLGHALTTERSAPAGASS